MRCRRPSTSPATSAPPAMPRDNLPPPGSGIAIKPINKPMTIPTMNPMGLSALASCSLSPKNDDTSSIRAFGAVIRTRSPTWITKSSVARKSMSPGARESRWPRTGRAVRVRPTACRHRVVGHGDAAEVQGFAVKFEGAATIRGRAGPRRRTPRSRDRSPTPHRRARAGSRRWRC